MERNGLVDRSLEALLADELAHVVDMVLLARDGVVEAHGRRGSVGFRRSGPVWERGANPLAKQDPAAFSPLASEKAEARPDAERNSYPFAYDSAAQLFEDPRAPDLVVVHTPAHNWEERGGHRGEHGSLNVVQSRAPLILAGHGVRRLGLVPAHARMIDVAPTIARLLGIQPPNAAEGAVLEQVLDRTEEPARVVAVLWDGANANVLYEMAAAGELPNVARLMRHGTSFAHGCIASFPSVTLANHTTALTGAHPGRHGVLNNVYFDQAAGRQIVTNAPQMWHLARDEIRDDVETLFDAVSGQGSFAAAVNEPIDRGARYSTFDLVRAAVTSGQVSAAGIGAVLPDAVGVPHTTREFVRRSAPYGWASSADHLAMMQASSFWRESIREGIPRFLWVNFVLPDAASHAGGPYSDIGLAGMRDTDARLGAILDAMDWEAGETAILLLADHGMEESDPDCKGDFDVALARAGVPFRDEGYGFVYFRPPDASDLFASK